MRFSITRGGLRVTLGLIWLLDGALQFQSFMYSKGFLKQVIEPSAEGQPAWIGRPIVSAAHFAGHNLTLWNTLFALVQVGIGLGLLFRRTARPALLVSFGWALVVWWFGEGFGMIPMGMASPLTGAPGAVLLYGLIGLLVWPTEESERDGSSAGAGLIGERGGLVVWSLLWAGAAALWCLSVNRMAGATSEALRAASGSSMHWLASLQSSLARSTAGHGEAIAVVLAVLSLSIAVGVWTRLRTPALALGALLSIAYWALGQGLGDLTSGKATDPNAGPLFVLLALALMPEMTFNKFTQDVSSKGETRMQDSRKKISLGSGQRWAALGVLLAVMALAVSGCGGSSGEKTEASVVFKPMAVWDASHGAKTQTSSMKGMSASEMKEMQSTAKAAEGMPFLPSSASGEGHFEQVGDHLTGWRRITGLVPYSRHANHLHGPDGACSPESKQVSNMAVVLPDLVANGKGEAYGTVNLVVHQRVIGPGYFLVVHAKPTPASQLNQIGSAPASMAFMQAMSNDPAILCGDITVKS
jgi:F0F1-type ATP synthase assembly protein I